MYSCCLIKISCTSLQDNQNTSYCLNGWINGETLSLRYITLGVNIFKSLIEEFLPKWNILEGFYIKNPSYYLHYIRNNSYENHVCVVMWYSELENILNVPGLERRTLRHPTNMVYKRNMRSKLFMARRCVYLTP